MTWQRHLRPTLEDLEIYDSPPRSRDDVRLHANESPEVWPPEVFESLAARLREIELNRYPDTSGHSLRACLARRLGCTVDRVVLGAGSDEIISLLLMALSGGTDGALVIPTPTFVMYAHSARVLGLEVRGVPTDAELQLDRDAMHVALRGAALCFLARPNNPTSALWDRAVVEELVSAHEETVFVIDEAYAAYSPGCSLFDANGPSNVVHMSTLSKIGLAALRIGYCVAPPELALAMDKIRHPYNLSTTSLAFAELVLERYAEVSDALVARVIENRSRLVGILESIEGARVFPAHANFALVDLGSPARAASIARDLAGARVIVKPLADIPGFATRLRVGVGTREELDRLAAALRR